MIRNLKLIANTQRVTKSEPEFPVKGSETTPLDSFRLRVEVLYKLSCLNKVWAHKLYLACI